MADLIFKSLSLLRDAWRYVRDLRDNLEEAQKDVAHAKGTLRYLDQTCRELASVRLSDAEHDRVHSMLTEAHEIISKCEPAVRKYDRILTALVAFLNRLTRPFYGTRTMVFALKVNTKLTCKLVQKALSKLAVVQAEAAEDAKSLRELHKKLAAQVEMGKGAPQTFDVVVKNTPALERIATAFDALAMVTNCMSVGKSDNIDRKDADADGDSGGGGGEKMLAGNDKTKSTLASARTSTSTHEIIVDCALGAGLFGAEAAPSGIITAEHIKKLLGPEFADFAGTLHDEMNADNDEKLTVQEFGAFVGKHAESNLGFALATAAAYALVATEDAAKTPDAFPENLRAFGGKLSEMAGTMLRPLIGRMVAFGLIMFSLSNPAPAPKPGDLLDFMDDLIGIAKDSVPDLRTFNPATVAMCSLDTLADNLDVLGFASAFSRLREMLEGAQIEIMQAKLSRTRVVLDGIASQVHMTATSLVALDSLPSYNVLRPRGPTSGHLGKGALAAQNLSEAVQTLTPSHRALLTAALQYSPQTDTKGGRYGGMYGGSSTGGGRVRATTSHGGRSK